MSTISRYFDYARLADAAYVDLSATFWSDPVQVALRAAALGVEKLPLKLAQNTFNNDAAGWQVADYYDAENATTGFASTLFKNTSGRYVLGIRGTETEPFGQFWLDLIKVDLGEIGFLGLALRQTVSMVNYVLRLQGDVNSSSVLQFNLRTSNSISAPNPQAIGQAGSWYWLDSFNNERGLGKIPVGTRIDVTGHSLGGHLAALATRLFPSLVNEAVVFNAPGFDPTVGQINTGLGISAPLRLTDEVMALFAQRMPVGASFRSVTMLDGEDSAPGNDVDLVSGLLTGAPFGPTQKVAVEKNSHGMGQIVDSLTVQRLFHQLDPGSALASFEPIYRNASTEDRTAVESLLVALERQLTNPAAQNNLPVVEAGTGLVPLVLSGDFAARTEWYKRWQPVNDSANVQSLNGKVQLAALNATSNLISSAKTDFGDLIALKTLSSFALKAQSGEQAALDAVWSSVHGPAHTAWTADKNARLSGDTTKQFDFSDPWYADRAQMLQWVLKANEENINYVANNGRLTGQVIAQPTLFDDKASATRFTVSLQPLSQDALGVSRVIFGLDDNSALQTLTGADASDHLYGGNRVDELLGNGGNDYVQANDGADIVDGGAGRDILFGGDGLDRYRFATGHGTDIVVDADGGRIEWGGQTLSSAQKPTANAGWWETSDRGYRLALLDTDASGVGRLMIQRLSAGAPTGDVIHVEKFSVAAAAQWGLALTNAAPIVRPSPTSSLTINGDLEPADQDLTAPGVQIGYDPLGNVLVTGAAKPDRVDILYDSAANDKLNGKGGNDYLNAFRGGDDALDGGSGDDVLLAGAGNDLADGGGGNDRINGDLGNDYITGGDDNDYIGGGLGNDVIYGGLGSDMVFGGRDSAGLTGGFTIDAATVWTFGQDWFSTLGFNPYTLDRVITGMPSTFNNGADDDKIFGDAGVDILAGDQGDDLVDGGSEGDLLLGGHGNDRLIGGAGNDDLVGDGFSLIPGQLPGFGVIPESAHGSDLLQGDAGTDRLYGGGGRDTLLGGADDDELHGDILHTSVGILQDADLLDGGAGNDKLYGDGGDDVLRGGLGADQLVGGTGNDTYEIQSGDSTAALADTIDDVKGMNTIAFGPGITRDTVTFVADPQVAGEYLQDRISFGVAREELRFASTFAETSVQLSLMDGPIIDLRRLVGTTYARAIDHSSRVNETTLNGGSLADRLEATSGNSSLHGGLGNDDLHARRGGNTFVSYAGDGADVIRANYSSSTRPDTLLFADLANASQLVLTKSANDLLVTRSGTSDSMRVINYYLGGVNVEVKGTTFVLRAADIALQTGFQPPTQSSFVATNGNDVLTLTNGADSVAALMGNDTVNALGGNDLVEGNEGSDILLGGAGADILIGGSGDDRLDGGEGNDLLLGGEEGEAGATGADTYLFGRGDGNDVIEEWDSSTSVIDTIEFKLGVREVDVTASRVGDDLVLTINGTSETLTVKNQFKDGDTSWSIERIRFVDEPGKVLDPRTMDLQLTGGPGDDLLVGTAGKNLIHGLSGNDSIFGMGGADTLYGGDGEDFIVGDSALSPGVGWTSYANDGNDFIDGGAGNDRIYSWAGDDTVYGGSGNDTIDGLVRTEASSWLPDGNDYFDGGDGNDHLSGGSGSNVLLGGAGDDHLSAGVFGLPVSSNVFDGGLGSDTLGGLYSRGADTYRFRPGDGNDFVDDGGGVDRLELGTGVSPADIVVRSNGNSLSIDLPTGDGIVFQRALAPSGAADVGMLEEIAFANGTVWNLAQIRATALLGTTGRDRIFGFDTNDSIDGGAEDDVLIGLGGNDSMVGGAGNDMLVNGPGDDRLDGGTGDDVLGDSTNFVGTGNQFLGNDTYIFGRGYGRDVIYEQTGDVNTISVKADLLSTDARVVRTSHGALVLTHGAGDDAVMFWEGTINQIVFASGTTWNAAQITALAQPGSFAPNATPLIGTSADDSLYSSPFGARLVGLAGNDNLTGNLNGVDADDILEGGTGDDNLSGLGGNDLLDGGSGADLLFGGKGSDTLISQGQGAIFAYEVGDGKDRIQNSIVGANALGTLEFGPDITESDLAFVRPTSQSNNLVIRFTGRPGDEIVVVNHFASSGTLRTGGLSKIIFHQRNELTRSAIDALTVVDGSQGPIGGGGSPGIPPTFSTIVNGTTGNDSLSGGANNELINGLAGDDVLSGQGGDDTLDGAGGADTLWGGSGNDWIRGGDNNDLIGGNSGSNTLFGGNGDDFYIIESISDVVVEFLNEGSDRIQTPFSWRLGANLEGLTLTGQASLAGFGNALANSMLGNAGNNTLSGDAGNDYIDGGAGDDQIDGGAGSDTLRGGLGNDTLTSGLAGGVNPEFLDGGKGNDNLISTGSGANFAFVRDDGNDIVTNKAATGLASGVVSFFSSGINATDVVLSRGTGTAVDDLIIAIVGGTQSITVQNHFRLTGGIRSDGISGISFANGVFWSRSTIDANTSGGGATPTGGNDVLRGTPGNDAIDALGGDDVVYGDAGDDILTGGLGNDSLYGEAGNDRLDGSSGNDTLIGGLGNDTYIIDVATDSITEAASAGTDTVQSTVSYMLGANVENLTLTGTAAINGTGNTLNNALTGNTGANRLDGGAGNDTMAGGTGDDVYVVDSATDVVTEGASAGTDRVESSVTYVLGVNVENLVLTGTTAINGTGNTLVNALTGNAAANVLNGGAGADTMSGGLGDDIYVVDNAADVVTEAASAGTDRIDTSITTTLGANVENLTLTGTAAINGTGNTLNNIITGNSAANVLTGGVGNDTLNGGAGIDTLIGGIGNDIYVVDVAGDIVTELAAEGTDTIQSAITWTLGTNVENLTLTGTAVVNGTGNTLNNVITGNAASNTLTGGAGNDTLNGGGGIDTLIGGAGNDILVVDNVGDITTELVGEGTDTVQASIGWTLGANLENLTLTGTSTLNGTGNTLDNVLTGNSAANVLTGDVGNDTLNGGTGADTMIGGAGNDVYVVDNAGDVVTEAASAGTDRVDSSVTTTLSANVENLTLTGTTAINGTGNTLNNIITGNSGANVLNGGAGNDTINGGAGIDTMIGGIGNDTFVVDNVADVVTELVNEGTDTVQASVSWTLGANLENLTLTGTSALNGIGNTLNNVLTGNAAANTLTGGAGNDTLNGGAGADTLVGGLGDDTYVVDAAGDVITEVAGEGTDSVQSSITYALGATLENLTLTGTAAINGTGSAANNIITGNSAANVLSGGAGNDTLTDSGGANVFIGGAGNDTLNVTSTGIDRIAMARGHGIDTLIGTGTAANDVLEVSNGIAKSAMGLMKTGNDLIVDLGAGETLTLRNWYAGVRNVGTLKIIGDAAWVPGQAATPTQVETLNMASLVSAFDAWRVANPTLTRWPLDSFGASSLAATSAMHLEAGDADHINPLRPMRTMAVDDGVAPMVALAPPYSPDVSALQTVTQRNLKSFMGFWNRPTEQSESESAASTSRSEPSAASAAVGDMIFGAPRALALAGRSAANSGDAADGWARTLPAARKSLSIDALSTGMAHIQPVARSAPWWESLDSVTEVSSRFIGEVERRPEVKTPFIWEAVHSELKQQLTDASETAMGEQALDDGWASAGSSGALINGTELQHPAIVEDAQRVAGRLGQRLL